MGTLFYGAARTPVPIDDHTLQLVRTIAGNKLRRGEGFMLSWKTAADTAHARSSVWMHSQTDLHFSFESDARAPADRDKLEAMSIAANSSRGLELEFDGVSSPAPRR